MKRVWQIGNILSLLFALIANYLVGTGSLNIPAINDISDKYATPLTPAGYAFSIWSLIYILLIIFAMYQARDLIRPNKDNDLPRIVGPLFIIASICNGLWTYVFVREFVELSVIILLVLTAALYIMLGRLKIATDNPPLKTIICVWWPLMLYAGWVTVASVVNLASWLQSRGITLPPLIAGITLVLLGTGLLVLLMKRNVRELLAACIWGIAAIGFQQQKTPENEGVAFTAFAVSCILFIGVTIHAYIYRKDNPLYLRVKRKVANN